MWDNIKEAISKIFDQGFKAREGMRTPTNAPTKVNPDYQKTLDTNFLKDSLSQPRPSVKESYLKSIQNRTFNPDNFRFMDPMISDSERQQQTPSFQSLAERMSSLMENLRNKPSEVVNRINSQAPDLTAWMRQTPNSPAVSAEDRINNFAGSAPNWMKTVGNLAADFTYRIPTRLVASGFLSDPKNKGLVPEDGRYQPKDPMARLLLGDREVRSFQTQTADNHKNLTGWGVPETYAKVSAPMFVGLGVALDLSTGGKSRVAGEAVEQGVKQLVKSKADDAVEMAWKAKGSLGRLKALTNGGEKLINQGWSKAELDKLPAKALSFIEDNGMTQKAWQELKGMEEATVGNVAKFRETFKDYIGQRQVAKLNGIIKSKEFQHLDEIPLQELAPMIESGNHSQALTKVTAYFQDALARMRAAGLNVGDKGSTYLPHMFKETEEESALRMGRRITPSTKFSIVRTLKDYQEGLSVGLHSRFDRFTDLIKEYESSISKAIADKKVWDYMKDEGLIMTKPQIEKGSDALKRTAKEWLPIDNKLIQAELKTGESYYANNDVRKVLENFLMSKDPTDSMVQLENGVIAVNQTIKTQLLTSGLLPKTGFNSYGFIMHARNKLASKNPILATVNGYLDMIHPARADKFMEENIDEAADAVKHGLTLDNQYFDIRGFVNELPAKGKNIAVNVFNAYTKKMDDWFAKDTFKIIQKWKLNLYKQDVKLYTDAGLEIREAKRLAAESINEIMASKNVDALLQSKSFQTMKRIMLLAPQYTESSIDVGRGLANVFLKPNSPQSAQYRLYMRNMIIDYIGKNVMNYSLTGKWMYQNSQGNLNNVETNLFDSRGKRVIMKSSGQDYLSIPMDVAQGIKNGDADHIIQDKLWSKSSPLISLGKTVMTGRDYRGQPITKDSDTGGQKLMKWGNEFSKYLIPKGFSEIGKSALGDQSWAQGIMNAGEMPVRFTGGATTDAEREKLQLMQDAGMSNQEVNAKLETDKSYNKEKKLTEAQQRENIKAGNRPNEPLTFWGKPTKNPSTKASDVTTDTNTASLDDGSLIGYSKQEAAIKAKKDLVKLISSSVDTDAQFETALKKEGISLREGMSILIKDMPATSQKRADQVYLFIENLKSKEEIVQTLAELAKDEVFVPSVVDTWVESGKITEATGKDMRNIIKIAKGQKVTGLNGDGSATGKKGTRPPVMKLPVVRASTVKPVIPKLSSDSASSFYKFKPRQVGGVRQIASKLPSLSDMKAAIDQTTKLSAVPQGWSR